MTPAPLRLVFDPSGDELGAAERCEADVFLETFGNTAEEFDVEYGPYVAQTGFMAVLQEDGEAVAASRFIAPGPAGLKTLNDVGREPWGVDGLRSAKAAGVDPDRSWDIATIAVRRGSGRGGLCAAAMYHGLIAAALENGIGYFVAIMDARPRSLLTALGIQSFALPGTKTGEYLGSTSSTPLWSDLHRTLERQQQENPDAFRLIRHGIGMDGVQLPTEWPRRDRQDAEGS